MREGDKRAVKMALSIGMMDKDNHPKAAVLPAIVLDAMRTSGQIWRFHLVRIESGMQRVSTEALRRWRLTGAGTPEIIEACPVPGLRRAGIEFCPFGKEK